MNLRDGLSVSKMQVLRVVAAIGAGCLSAPAHAQTPGFLPPPEMVDRVLDALPDVQAAKAGIDLAKGEARKLAAGPHEFVFSAGFDRRETKSGIASFDEYNATVMRGVRLPGKAALDKKIADAGVFSSQQFAEDARHQAALMLMTHWIAWLSAAEMESIEASQEQTLSEERRILVRRVEVDDAARIEVDLAAAAHEEARASRTRAHAEAERARALLQLAFPDLEVPVTSPEITEPFLLHDPAAWEARTIEHSHEIGFFQSEADRLKVAAARARADRIPDPDIGLRAFSERGGEETGIGVVITIPLGGGARAGLASREAAAAEIARQALERVTREIRSTAREDVIAAQAEREAWLAASAALQSSETAIRRMRNGFALQAYDLADLLAAERRHGDVRRLEATSRARAQTAWLKLMIDSHELWMD